MENLDKAFETNQNTSDTAIARDLRLNLKRILGEGSLDKKEGHLALLALATSAHIAYLQEYAQEELKSLGAEAPEILEARESAAIMGMLNTYYKFKFMLGKDGEYGAAGLRMTALAKPILGKVLFEKLAFAVSVLNGCQSCIASHEDVLRKHEVTVNQIHDLARLAAVVAGLKAL